jgi:hypothetical protein
LKNKLFLKKSIFCLGSNKKIRIPDKKIDFFFKQLFSQKILKLKNYYAKWTLRIEVVNGKKPICYCIFSVYLVTGTKNLDISEEGTFRISKLFFYITTMGTLKDGQTRFLGPFHWTHIGPCHLDFKTTTFDDKNTSFQPTIVVTYISAFLVLNGHFIIF